jgi:hypothetical protein
VLTFTLYWSFVVNYFRNIVFSISVLFIVDLS